MTTSLTLSRTFVPLAVRSRRQHATAPTVLQTLAERAQRELAGAPAERILRWAFTTFGDGVVVASSMGDTVLAHLASRVWPGVNVLFLDTGYHFPETLGTADAVESTYDVTLLRVRPAQTVAEQDAEFGAELFARDPNLCCARRKVEPLQRTLTGYELWFTGVRREEAPTRTATPFIGWDEKNGLVKVNPLAAWTFDELLDYATANAVPLNLLLSNGYPSIGCEPCTKPVAEGEDPRSGRWAGLAKTECGLHQ